jgi:O-antigen biosynthesis protein
MSASRERKLTGMIKAINNMKSSNPKGVVYTCVTGNYDRIINHHYIDKDWHYICFTDCPPENPKNYIWEFLPLAFNEMDNVRNQRWHKLHPHLLFPDYKNSLYIDANLDILTCDIFNDVENQIIQGQIIAIVPHFSINNIYDEFAACVQQGKDLVDIIKKQEGILKELGFSGDYMNGRFFETNIIYRQHHNKVVAKIMHDWWWFIQHYSYRDQLSLTFVLWKFNINVPLLADRTYRESNIIKYNYGEHHITLSEAKNRIAELNREIATMKGVIAEKDQKIKSLLGSRSWRITRPLRQIDDAVRKVRQLMAASAQRLYDAIPLPPHIRTPISNFVFACFGAFFKDLDPYQQWLAAKKSGVITPIETYYEKVPDSADKITELIFRHPKEPIVSIIIPVFNNWRYTYACLQAIRERSGDDVTYEIIIADDHSTDDTHIMLERIQGIQILRNTRNLGYIFSCNNAVKFARGKYVVFLNNDTEVQSDWLNPLVDLFERSDQVGMIGGKLLYPDGRVQEAGGIILQNGWGHPYGRHASPASYEFNYVKEVDCLIGACLMVDKNLFVSLGGFDEAFAPAYYEEFDFAFTLRKQGYKILYQPASRILHFDSSSYGTASRDKQSLINQRIFCNKWQDVLTRHAAAGNDLFLARDRSRGKKIILVIDDRVPEYDQQAGGLTIYQYLRLFSDMGFKVIFLPDSLDPVAPYTSELQQLGIEVIYGGIDVKKWLGKYGKYLHYAWLARPNIASNYIGILKKSASSKILYFTHDLHYLREHRLYALNQDPLHLDESQRLKKLEFDLFSQVDVILTPSSYEEQVIKENFPYQKVFTIPLHLYEFPPEDDQPGVDFSQRQGLLFLGGFNHLPNVDAVLWFVREILPRVRERLPEVSFTVAGSNPPQEILALQHEGLRVTGYVPDLGPLFEKTRVFVAPLRYGAGVKGKIITSMVQGVPVVTTSIGNEGLNLAPGQEALIADDAAAFAARLVEIYTNQALWERLARQAQTYVRHHFSKAKARQLMQTVLGMRGER